MKKEQIQSFYENLPEEKWELKKNKQIKGLNIMSKYCDDITLVPEHDELRAYLDKAEQYELITEEDLTAIFRLHWRWDEEFECFAIFC